MKFKHVLLFGVVASIMSYLNSETCSEQDVDRQEEILSEIKELLDSDANELTIDKKLNQIKEEMPEHYEKAEEMAKDVSDDLIDELNSIVASISAITEEVVDDFVDADKGQEIEIEGSEDTDKEKPVETKELENNSETEAYRENIIKDLEDLLNDIRFDDESEPISKPDEEPTIALEEDEKELASIDDLMDDILETEEQIDENPVETEEDLTDEYTEDDFLRQIEEAINKAAEDFEEEPVEEPIDNRQEIDESEIDDIFADIVNNEPNDTKTEPVEEPDGEKYISDLIDELKADLNTKEEAEVKEEPIQTIDDVYARIQELYPNLNLNFIRSVYNLKESLAYEYPLDKMVIVLHRLSFTDLKDLYLFTDIVINHDYRVNVDEKKMIVDILKEFRNTDGKILTNIFEVANQAKVLNGEYEGYHIEVE